MASPCPANRRGRSDWAGLFGQPAGQSAGQAHQPGFMSRSVKQTREVGELDQVPQRLFPAWKTSSRSARVPATRYAWTRWARHRPRLCGAPGNRSRRRSVLNDLGVPGGWHGIGGSLRPRASGSARVGRRIRRLAATRPAMGHASKSTCLLARQPPCYLGVDVRGRAVRRRRLQ